MDKPQHKLEMCGRLVVVETTADTAALLRLEVARLRARESRRLFDAAVSVGVLAGGRDTFLLRAQDQPTVDDALRVDIVCALLEGGNASVRTAWLVRPGPPELQDQDLAWLAASSRAFDIADVRNDGFYVITRAGWLDVRTGRCKTWKRLRL